MSTKKKSGTSGSSSDSAVSSAMIRRREFGWRSGFASYWATAHGDGVVAVVARPEGPLVASAEAQWTHVVAESVG